MFEEIFTEPTRRGFLGSIIGSLITSKLPFLAQVAKKHSFGDTYYERIERLLYLNKNDFLKFKGLVHTEEGGQIWAPSIEKHTNGLFIFESIEANQKFITDSSSLIDDEGYLLGTGFYQASRYVCGGDILHVDYRYASLDIIKLMIKSPDFELNGRIITPKTKAMRVI